MEPVKNIAFKIFQTTKGIFEIKPLSANRKKNTNIHAKINFETPSQFFVFED